MNKYRGKEFSWTEGVTCVHLAKFQLRQMGRRSPTLPRFRSELAARKAMKEHGWSNVIEMLDSILPRITPAQMMLGDLCAAASGDEIGGIFICAGPSKAFGWREDAPQLVVLDISLDELDGAWRV
jgi:hypothetical protein